MPRWAVIALGSRKAGAATSLPPLPQPVRAEVSSWTAQKDHPGGSEKAAFKSWASLRNSWLDSGSQGRENSLVGSASWQPLGPPAVPLGSSEPCLPSTASVSSTFGPQCPRIPQLCIYQQFIYHFLGPGQRQTELVPNMAGRFGNNYGTAREAPRTILTAPMTREAGVRPADVTPLTVKGPLFPAPRGRDLKRFLSF